MDTNNQLPGSNKKKTLKSITQKFQEDYQEMFLDSYEEQINSLLATEPEALAKELVDAQRAMMQETKKIASQLLLDQINDFVSNEGDKALKGGVDDYIDVDAFFVD